MGFYATTEVRDENRCSPVFRSDKSENRLVKTESLASVPDAAKAKVENLYDYAGRRVRKTVSSGYSGGTYTTTNVTTYVWDGFNIIAEMCDAGYTNWYTYGLDLSGTLQGAGGVGGALAMTRDTGTATNTYLYCFDGNVNVVGMVDEAGSVVASYEYDPFGVAIKATGSQADSNAFRFSTHYFDSETGLYNAKKRYYSPTLGRFINRDPLEEEMTALAVEIETLIERLDNATEDEEDLILAAIIGTTLSSPLYQYVGNNPVNSFDPFGEWDWMKFVGCFAGLSASELSALRGAVSKEILSDPKVAKELSKQIAKQKKLYGKAWKKARNKVIKQIKKKLVKKAVKNMGRKALLKTIGSKIAGRLIPGLNAALFTWDLCKAVYCGYKAF